MKKEHTYTLGIEEEFAIVDPQTRELRSHIQEILEGGKVLLKEQIKPKWRADVVPADPPSDSLSHRGCGRKAGMGDILTEAGCLVRQRVRSRPRNYSWAELLHRVFSIDVLECASCGGRLRIVAAIHPPEAIRRILDCLGIPSRAPPIAAASRDAADWKFSE